jgi:uncharacterized protein (DUF2147 family)
MQEKVLSMCRPMVGVVAAMIGAVMIGAVLLLLVVPVVAHAQQADAIVGRWLTEDDKSIVEIVKTGTTYAGKIVWIRDSLENGKPTLDKHNPNAALRSKPVVGLQILSHLKFHNHQWIEGVIYDPENGKEYSCKASIHGDTLDLRGYVLGIPLFGRTTTWRRR